MKKLICLILMLGLLAGCTPKPPETTESTQPPQTTAGTQTIPTTEATQPSTEAPVTILDYAVLWEYDTQLLELKLPVLEERWDTMALLSDRMVLSRIDYNEDGTEGHMTMTAVDLRTGEPTGRVELFPSCYVIPQILQDTVVLCDNAAGIIYRWDRDLEPVSQWELSPDDSTWQLGLRDGEPVLYRFGYRTDLTAETLSTGERTTVLQRNPNLWSVGVLGDQLTTMCVEGPNLMQYPCSIDLLTGEVQRIPTEWPMISATRVGQTWFAQGADSSDYHLIRDGETLRVRQQFTTMQQLSDGNLTQIDQEGTRLSLFSPEGIALGVCRPADPEGDSGFGQLLPCEMLGGYLLPVYEWEGAGHILLWKPFSKTAGENLVMEPLEEPSIPEGTAVDPALYERAEKLGKQYGLEICIADQINVSASGDRTIETLLDEAQITEGLDLLEQVLSRYPENFFRQLRWNRVHRLQVHLAGRIYRGDSYTIDGGIGGFVTCSGDACLVVVDATSAHDFTYAHEFSHVIDRKLQWDADCRSDSAYSEESWAALNPEGFVYTDDYTDVAYYFEGEDRRLYGWFLSPYGTVNSTEDRAQVMEAAVGSPWTFDEAPGLQQKLRYYSDCIRDCFDTTGWPEKTVWEQVLN